MGGGSPGLSALYKLDFTIGIDDPDPGDRRIGIYPNPARDEINITFTDEFQGEIRISIYNQLGQKILNQEVFGDRIDISCLVPGLFILEISNEDWIGRERFIVNR